MHMYTNVPSIMRKQIKEINTVHELQVYIQVSNSAPISSNLNNHYTSTTTNVKQNRKPTVPALE